MAQTLRQAAYRAREDLYVCLVECLECGSPAGTRCTNRVRRPVITCCGIRAELAQPMAYAIMMVILELRAAGYLRDTEHELPAIVARDFVEGGRCSRTR